MSVAINQYFVSSGLCTFEKDKCGFNDDPTGQFTWTRKQGSTPSSKTGPSSDHTTGSISGMNIIFNIHIAKFIYTYRKFYTWYDLFIRFFQLDFIFWMLIRYCFAVFHFLKVLLCLKI